VASSAEGLVASSWQPQQHHEKFILGVEHKPGDLVIVCAETKPKLRIVLRADSCSVRMAELGEQKMEIGYQGRAVISAPLPSFSS
jgi:hypothetical protein